MTVPPSSEGPCFSGRATSKDLEATLASEGPCFSSRASEVPLPHKLSDNAHRMKSNEAPQEQKFDENAHIHASRSSKGSTRAQKLEKQFRDLTLSWKPSPLLLDCEPGTEDLSWLFGNSGQHRVKSDAMSPGVSSAAEDLSRRSSVCSFQPKALYLPALEMYQLPYVVPF